MYNAHEGEGLTFTTDTATHLRLYFHQGEEKDQPTRIKKQRYI